MSYREYICTACYLIWAGEWEGKREDCPYCQTPNPHAADTFGAAYWERDLGLLFGDDFFCDNYWQMKGREVNSPRESWNDNHEPNPNRPDYEEAITLAFSGTDNPYSRAYYEALGRTHAATRKDLVDKGHEDVAERFDANYAPNPSFEAWLKQYQRAKDK